MPKYKLKGLCFSVSIMVNPLSEFWLLYGTQTLSKSINQNEDLINTDHKAKLISIL